MGGSWRQEVRGQRLEMPLFEGDDSDGWAIQAERYLPVTQLTKAKKWELATLGFEGRAISWSRWERRRRREIRVGKKTNLKNEAMGLRHRVFAQAMAKKGKALKKPRGRLVGGRRGCGRPPIVDKQP